MLKQYSLLTDCLSELKASSFPSIEKLRLEVDLIELKQLLLEPEIDLRIAGVEESETEFNDLFNLVRYACTPEGSAEGLDGVNSQIQKIRTGLTSGVYLAPRTIETLIHRYIFRTSSKKTAP